MCREKNEDWAGAHVTSTLDHSTATPCAREGGGDDEVCMQQQWVKRWIREELTRSVSRREVVRHWSSPSTGEKLQQRVSQYEEWVSSSSPTASLLMDTDANHDDGEDIASHGLEPEPELGVFPTTVFINSSSGEAVSTGNGVVTIQNRAARVRSVCVDASCSVLMTRHGSSSALQAAGGDGQRINFEIQPFSFMR
jgi:hypothetical protein